MARLAAAVLGACVVAFSGCVELRSPVNAPWHIDVQTPPDSIDVDNGVPEAPRDPGAIIGRVSGGVLAGVGGATRGPGSTAEEGVEFSLQGAVSRASEPEGLGFIPDWMLGLNVGWMLASRSGQDRHGSDRGLMYAELQAARSIFWLAPGWGVALVDRASGPQLTTGAGPVYLRYAYLPETGSAVLIGLALKGHVDWVRVRR